MTIYVYSDNICHTIPNEDCVAYERPEFDGKCEEFVSGYMCIHGDEPLTLNNGITYPGLAFFLVKPMEEIYLAQLEYERDKLVDELRDADAALERLGVVSDKN